MSAPTEGLAFGLFSSFKLVRQAENTECGLACLAMVAQHFGHEVSVLTLRRTFESSARGLTVRDLALTAEQLGMTTRAVRCDLHDLPKLRLPAILHWNLGHFVVLHAVKRGRLQIADPSLGHLSMTVEQASPHFTGIAIEVARTPQFERRDAQSRLSVRKLIRFTPAMTGSFVQALLLSVLLQIALLSVPLYMQLAIDEGVQRGDADILTVLLVAVLAVTVFAGLTSFLRGLTVQYITQSISFDMNSTVFNHLVRLPMSFFQKRQVGDLQQRFRSLVPIQQALGTASVTSIIDGALVIVVLLLMFFYSGILTFAAIAFVLASVIVRLTSLRASRNAASAVMVAEAREQSRFLETLRAMATIKVNAVEGARGDTWMGNNASTINAQIRRGNITQITTSLTQVIGGASDAIILFLGAKLALSGQITIGVLTAFLAYKQLFTTRVTALVDQLIMFALLDVQLDRVADIALSDREAKIDDAAHTDELLQGKIELRNVSFRYSRHDPWVFQSLNLTISPGEFVAITGPSGGGKTTLLRILVGFNTPSMGAVLFDDRELGEWGPRPIREQISLVLQDDQLFAGTLLDNITLFSSDPDLDRVERAIEKAALTAEIKALPMGLGTLIGDMGSLLSGGQKQRVLIARALYRQPRILIMDEGTSHLDLEREKLINTALKELRITRIVVAHRPETIAAADKVLRLSQSKLQIAL